MITKEQCQHSDSEVFKIQINELRLTLNEAVSYAQKFTEKGLVASYIPELSKADKSAIEVCIALRDGTMCELINGDNPATRFTLQSISKVVALILALQKHGEDYVFSKVGMEPTGDPFNSLMKLETADEKPFNPLINAGAIVTAGMLIKDLSFDEIISFTSELLNDPDVSLNEAVFNSEKAHGSRNRALAYLLDSKGILAHDAAETVDLYFRLCSIDSTAAGLAHMGLVLSNGGVSPVSGKRLIDRRIVKCAQTLMMTCGMYDGTGEYALKVGIPSKSGVAGGIVSCTRQGFGIGVYGPSLDPKGNSIGGIHLLEYLSKELGLHYFGYYPN